MKTIQTMSMIALVAALVSGCSSDTPKRMERQQALDYGVVQSISVSDSANSGLNAGTLIGGAAGNQMGGGNGRTAVTVAGAVGGAVIGTKVENGSSEQMYSIQIRLDDGSTQTVTQKSSVADLRVGDRVHIQDGQAYRG